MRRPIHIHKNAGFTLVELLAVVLITAVISVVAVGVFVNSQVRGNKARTVSEVRQQGVSIVDQLDFVIRGATGIAPGTSCDVGMNELSLQSGDGSVTVIGLDGSRLVVNGVAISSSEVTIQDVSFSCQQASGQTGALISYQFLIQVGDQTSSPDSYFSQIFQSQVNIRSY